MTFKTYLSSCFADVALMHFFGALDTQDSLPVRANIRPRTDNRTQRVCRTIGSFAVYMHDYGLDQFDSRFRDDSSCWNVSALNSSEALLSACNPTLRNRKYTWWCNKRPNNPCVFGCPNQVRLFLLSSSTVQACCCSLKPCTHLRCQSASSIPQGLKCKFGPASIPPSTYYQGGQTLLSGHQRGSRMV